MSFEKFAKRFPKESFYIKEADPKPLTPFFPPEEIDADVVVLFGLDDGTFYKTLLPWLEKDANRHLVYVESDFGKVRTFLESENAFFQNPSLTLELLTDSFYKEVSWKFFGKKRALFALPGNEEGKEQFLLASIHKEEAMEEYTNYGIAYYKNFFSNLKWLPKSALATDLKDVFLGETAIIVGAGPSLTKQLSLLKQIEKKALIFAGGSSIALLLKEGINPDFSFVIDPNPLLAERLSKVNLEKTKLFYRLRVNAEILKNCQSSLFYVSGSGGYETARFFEEKLLIPPSDLDEGHNVLNFAAECACFFGIKRVIFIGLDLGYTEEKCYADGISSSALPLETLQKLDIYGNPLKTEAKWIKEAEWFSRFAKTHEEVEMINATEGGLGFAGSKVLPFEKALAFFLDREKPLVSLSKNRVDEEALRAAVLELKTSLMASVEHLAALLDPDLPPPMRALHEVELDEEIAWEFYLETFNSFFILKQSFEIGRINEIENSSLREEKKEALQKERLIFLKRVAEVGAFLAENALSS